MPHLKKNDFTAPIQNLPSHSPVWAFRVYPVPQLVKRMQWNDPIVLSHRWLGRQLCLFTWHSLMSMTNMNNYCVKFHYLFKALVIKWWQFTCIIRINIHFMYLECYLKLGMYYTSLYKFFDCFLFMYSTYVCLIYVTWILTCSTSFGLWPHVAGSNE